MTRPSRQFWDRISSTVRVLDKRSYYQLLGVSQDARGEQVVEAYYALVKQIHPDRHARERDPERKRSLVLLYARIGEAFRVLSNPSQREAYNAALEDGLTRLPPEDKSKQRELVDVRDPRTAQARQLYERGQKKLSERDFRGARAQWLLAKQFEPESKAIAQALEDLDEQQHPKAAAPSSPPAAAPAETAEPAAEPRLPPQQAEFVRQHPRFEVKRPVTVRCGSWENLETLYTRDISRGGMFLRSNKPLPMGMLLELKLALPDGRELTLSAEVAHVVPPDNPAGRPPGIGVKFDDMPIETRADIEAMLAGAKSTDDSVVRAMPVPAPEPTPEPNRVPPRPLLAGEDIVARADEATATAVRVARTAMLTGDYEKAVEALRVAIEPDPKNYRLRAAYHLARGYDARAAHRMQDATREFRAVLKYDPRCLEAVKALRRPHSDDVSIKIRRALVNRLVGKDTA